MVKNRGARARLEGMTRKTGDDVLLTAATRDALEHPVPLTSRGTLRLKGKTLRAREASPEMLHSIHELAEDIRRQVKRNREKARGRARSRRAMGRWRGRTA